MSESDRKTAISSMLDDSDVKEEDEEDFFPDAFYDVITGRFLVKNAILFIVINFALYFSVLTLGGSIDDPVIAEDNRSYSRESITDWFNYRDKNDLEIISPLNR